MSQEVFIIDALRTPIGSPFRSLKQFTAAQLAAIVITELLRRNKIKEIDIDQVILGNTVGAGAGQNMARQATVFAGLPDTVPAFTVNHVCGSGLQSVILSVQAIKSDDARLVIAGGTESASRSPEITLPSESDNGMKASNVESLTYDGLWCQLTNRHMGELSEHIARAFNISRQEQDEYSYQSYVKARKAAHGGKFKEEIVPVEVGENKNITKDERILRNLNRDKLKSLLPAFQENGTVTAGNSCIPCDGAGVLMIASKPYIEENDLVPRARILGYASIALNPLMVFTGAVTAIKVCLQKCNLSVEDVDLFEISEAFATQAILTQKKLGIPDEKMNIYGGDIALGHPLGAAGVRVLITLIHALVTQKKQRGIACACSGGGGAIAVAVDVGV